MIKNSKNKDRKFFSIPWARKHGTSVTPSSLKKIGIPLLALLIAIAAGWMTNVIPFAFGTIKCGQLPVESTKFAASYSYRLPGDKGYGLHIFSEYKFCSEAEIQATHSYHPSPGTASWDRNKAAQTAARSESERFSPSRIGYTIYRPEGYAVTKQRMVELHGTIHTFYTVALANGSRIDVRQIPKDNEYNLCHSSTMPSKRYCQVIGTDSQGREVNREYANGIEGWESRYVGVTIGGTGVILETGNDQDALAIINSLKVY